MKPYYKRYLAEKRRNRDKMLRMRASGKTLQEIADYFGISRQRVYQIIEKHSESLSLDK